MNNGEINNFYTELEGLIIRVYINKNRIIITLIRMCLHIIYNTRKFSINMDFNLFPPLWIQ